MLLWCPEGLWLVHTADEQGCFFLPDMDKHLNHHFRFSFLIFQIFYVLNSSAHKRLKKESKPLLKLDL